MQAFARLYQTIDQTTSTNAKVAAMVDYFRTANAPDAAWAVYFLSGRRIKRLVGAAQLRTWLTELSDLPPWLVDDTYSSVGDLAETIALLLARADDSSDELGLAEWVETRLKPLGKMNADEQRATVTGWWATQSYEQCYIVTKLMTGALRVGVSQTLLARAIAEHAELPRPTILHRMMGEWTPSPAYYESLVGEDDGAEVLSRPYPFCLASPLEAPVEKFDATIGPPSGWQAEWKWDGIRSQLVRRRGEIFLWSRGEDLIGERFPEIVAEAESLPDGTVLDGEILPWNVQGVLPFAELQRRIGRKTVGKKLLAEVPCLFLAYDLLEHHGEDIREEAMSDRRARMESLVADHARARTAPTLATASNPDDTRLRVSELLAEPTWEALGELRSDSRSRLVEGLMLKRLDSPYGTGRKRGLWWKWKIEPHTIDAVMLYAQAGHGRRSNLYTDYTFGVWQDGALVPFAKAYSGLDNAEINKLDKWIRKHTVERFGPVRSVKLEQVFELAFEGIQLSSRHKSGVAVRFPRIARWRHDLAPKDADSLDDVKALIGAGGAEA